MAYYFQAPIAISQPEVQVMKRINTFFAENYLRKR